MPVDGTSLRSALSTSALTLGPPMLSSLSSRSWSSQTSAESPPAGLYSEVPGNAQTRPTAAAMDGSIRVLFEITHPAHVHLFRHAIRELVDGGNVVGITSREKDVTTALLDAYELPHTTLSRKGEGPTSLLREWGMREYRLLRAARRFDPDVIVSRLNPAAAHVSALLGTRSVVFHDTELAGALARVSLPFADVICTPERFEADYGDRQVSYPGYHELAYLHPDRFEPDPTRLERTGVDPDEPYSVVRLVSSTAHHDIGAEGLSTGVVDDVVSTLSTHGSVYVTSEGPLPPALEPYRTPVPPEAIHDLLAFADLFVGDSGTMSAEAGILGTPSIRYSPHKRELSNFAELEGEYGLVRTVRDPTRVADTVADLLERPDLAATWDERRARMVDEKIDVTDFIVAVVRGCIAP